MNQKKKSASEQLSSFSVIWLTAAIAVIIGIVFCFGSNPSQPTPTEENLKESHSTEESFTMETLIQLCQSDIFRQQIQQQGLERFLIYNNLEQIQTKYSLTWLYMCILPYQTREYELQICYWLPETALKYGHLDYEIDSIVIVESETGDRQLLYSCDPRYTVNTDILSFLEKQYGIDQYMTLTLPDNYTLGNYQADSGIFSGCQILTDKTESYKEIPHGFAPEIWYVPGGIGILDTTDIFQFENGTLTNVSLLMNHSIPISEPETVDGCEVSALLIEYSFDLFTYSEWENYKNEHPETTAESTSEFWYIFLGKEESQNGYVVFLNKNYFTKEDSIRLAQSIYFTEKAF